MKLSRLWAFALQILPKIQTTLTLTILMTKTISAHIDETGIWFGKIKLFDI